MRHTTQQWNDVSCYLVRGWTCTIAKGVDPSIKPISTTDIFPGKFLICRIFIFFEILFIFNKNSYRMRKQRRLGS